MKAVHVAVAVIYRATSSFYDREILISKRLDHVHQGGLWEFPGGKVEKGEQVVDALARELDEELGIQIDKASDALKPLIEIHHDYGDKHVFLDVWTVSEFEGEPHGKEGQAVKWAPLSDLHGHEFPAANRPIVNASRLPRQYAITPEYGSLDEAVEDITRLISLGVHLISLRQPQLDDLSYRHWYQAIRRICRQHSIKLLVSGSINRLDALDCDGIQLPIKEALKVSSRPISQDRILSVSCHNEAELRHAERILADFVTLSPVCATESHPDVSPLGWQTFEILSKKSVVPIYALGGLNRSALMEAIFSGAQGIAGISCWRT